MTEVLEILSVPLITGLCIAVVTAPYGCFLVWGRMAFFGDTLAHAALPGVALAIWLQLDVTATLALSSVGLVLIFRALRQQDAPLSSDTLLAILAQGGLATGILGILLLAPSGPALESFLIGDLLTVSTRELSKIGTLCLVLGLILIKLWNKWLAITVNEELAHIDGLSVERLRIIQLTATAILVAISIRTVGVLLVSALLILPPASVRRLTNSPESMAVGAMLVAAAGVMAGVGLSWLIDAPAGPTVVASLVFVLVLLRLVPVPSS